MNKLKQVMIKGELLTLADCGHSRVNGISNYFYNAWSSVSANYDQADKRLTYPCGRCGEVNMVVVSYVTAAGSDRHQLFCGECGNKSVNLPSKVTAAELSAYQMPFGKFKGVPMAKVDRGYLEFLSLNMKASAFKRKVDAFLSIKVER